MINTWHRDSFCNLTRYFLCQSLYNKEYNDWANPSLMGKPLTLVPRWIGSTLARVSRYWAIGLLGMPSLIIAAEPVALETLEVTGQHADELLARPADGPALRFGEEALKTLAGPGAMSSLQAIRLAPATGFYSANVFGTNESAFHDPLRIRSKKQTGPGSVLTVEGLPVNRNPGGGKTMYDVENLAGIDLYQGYLPVAQSLGFSNLIGKVDLQLAEPRPTFGVHAKQMVGSRASSRTFLRIDSGSQGPWAAYASGSYTRADKWKGSGELERTNAMAGFRFAPTEAFSAEWWVVYNEDRHHDYYAMPYTQARDLDRYYERDFPADPTRAAFAEYNRQHFNDWVTLAKLNYAVSDTAHLQVAPYYADDRGAYWFNPNPTKAANTTVIEWRLDHDLYGVVADYTQTFSAALQTQLGFWWHQQQPPGPPTVRKKYQVVSGQPVFAGYAMLARTGNHTFHSPFAELAGQLGPFSYVAGLRYLDFDLAALRSYQHGTNAAAALANGEQDPLASVAAKHFATWLPSLRLKYALSPRTQAYLSYTKTHGFNVNLFPYYVKNRNQGQNFAAKDIALQTLWAKQRLEIAHNLDLGLRLDGGAVWIEPRAYWSEVSGKQAQQYDPALEVIYPSNQADARSYGLELSVGGEFARDFEYWLSGSYNRYFFTEDIRIGPDQFAATADKQIPDAARVLAKSALIYRHGPWRISPTLSYYGARYGDVENQQRIPGFVLADLAASYTRENVGQFEAVSVSLQFTNLFDQAYISTIITPDDAVIAYSSTSLYRAGPPLGVYGSLSINY